METCIGNRGDEHVIIGAWAFGNHNDMELEKVPMNANSK